MTKRKDNAYMILLADRKRAKIFTLIDGAVEGLERLVDGHVPQKVKHGSNTWDAQDKIMRHIEDHLHRHLELVARHAISYAKKNGISKIIIGSHKPLLAKVKKHFPNPFSRRIKGEFVTELKGPFNEVVRRARLCISTLEAKKEEEHA